jgi:hypothetical protein
MTLTHALLFIILAVLLTSLFWITAPGLLRRIRAKIQRDIAYVYGDLKTVIDKDEATVKAAVHRTLATLAKHLPN